MAQIGKTVRTFTSSSFSELKEERYNDSAREFNMALEINPVNTTGYTNLGVLHLRTGRPHEAVKCFEKALELNPYSIDTRQFLERARREVK